MEARSIIDQIGDVLPEHWYGRQAMQATVGRLLEAVSEPAWTVQTDGTTATVYLLVGRAIHKVCGKKKDTPDPSRKVREGAGKETCNYAVIPLAADASFTCEITRTVTVDDSAVAESVECVTQWQFKIDPHVTIPMEHKQGEPTNAHAERFATALAAEITRGHVAGLQLAKLVGSGLVNAMSANVAGQGDTGTHDNPATGA